MIASRMRHMVLANIVICLQLLWSDICHPQQSEKPTSQASTSADLSDEQIVQLLAKFKESVGKCDRLEFAKAGEGGRVTLTLRDKYVQPEFEAIASCMGSLEFKTIQRVRRSKVKPVAIPNWYIGIPDEAIESSVTDGKRVNFSIKGVLLEDHYVRFNLDDDTEIICDTGVQTKFGADDRLWSLFGKLLLFTLR